MATLHPVSLALNPGCSPNSRELADFGQTAAASLANSGLWRLNT